MEMLHSKAPSGVKRAVRLRSTPASLSTFSQLGTVKGGGGGAWSDSVAVGLVWVLWRLLGGRGVSHAALGQWCAWSWVLVGSMWIGALEHRRQATDSLFSNVCINKHSRHACKWFLVLKTETLRISLVYFEDQDIANINNWVLFHSYVALDKSMCQMKSKWKYS